MLPDAYVHANSLPPFVKEHSSESKSHEINVLGLAVAPGMSRLNTTRAAAAKTRAARGRRIAHGRKLRGWADGGAVRYLPVLATVSLQPSCSHCTGSA